MANDLRAMFDAVNDDYGEFHEIPEAERLNPRPDLCAFLYLHRKCPDTFDMVSAAEHDEIFLDVEPDRHEWTEADVLYLVRCGVRYSDDSFCMFV